MRRLGTLGGGGGSNTGSCSSRRLERGDGALSAGQALAVPVIDKGALVARDTVLGASPVLSTTLAIGTALSKSCTAQGGESEKVSHGVDSEPAENR